MGFFKYTDFFIGTVNDLLGTSIPLTGVPLPIGISFFTFQTMSYTIDVYWGRASAQRNLATFATFVCLFPQLIAGPIVRYTDVAAELESRKSTLEGVALGLRRFAFGLGKKVLLANAMGELCTAFRDARTRAFCSSGCMPWPFPCKSTSISPAIPTWPSAWAAYLASSSGEFPLSLYLQVHHRILAALAYDPGQLVPRLRLYPPGRQPLLQGKTAAESGGGSGC